MKNFILFLCFIFTISCKQDVSNLEKNENFIQDYTNLFSTTEAKFLLEKIKNHQFKTSNQICIYTIDSLPKNVTALNHATLLATQLGVGLKEKNNGLLLLISRYDRAIAIATGIGTEKQITDTVAYTIIENTIVPNFKNQEFYKGVSIALDSIFVKWN
ncbi:YgcG family protein [Lacinutrix sp. 5H-3-7-4]|uniref:TPM domain-containing protein n=1 Tax=Lacinutrix sp. (strain 5H-3-7-4) TaxID=983544 RepID=UPI00020A3329|nr:TPM domain-containing protein [Lacinutrix sp. 5H-3-7-4]AEH01444.1 protein of unknown function DUF477 [Lacinutrix sp. 5H-3-7-4]